MTCSVNFDLEVVRKFTKSVQDIAKCNLFISIAFVLTSFSFSDSREEVG